MSPTAAIDDPPTSIAGRGGRRSPVWVWGVLVGLLTLAVFLPTRRYGFVYYDDQGYLLDNPYVRHGLTWPGVRFALTGVVLQDYHPVTRLVELVVAQLFGPTPMAFHLTNDVLHATTAALLFAFLAISTGRTGVAAAAAVLWSVHPLRVESVAWMAGLKDETSGCLWAACLLAYAGYARRRTVGRYAAVGVLCGLALLAKTTTVTLPLVLLLTDFWPLCVDRPPAHAERWWLRRLLEKLPLLAMAAAAAAVSVAAHGNLSRLTLMPLSARLGNAVASLADYLRETVWPAGLAIFYPHPWVIGRPVPTSGIAAGAMLLVGVSAAVLIWGRRRPYLAVGWFWFVLVLAPVSGVLQPGDIGRADRYTYLPAMGLTTAVAFLIADVIAPWGATAVAAAAAVALAAVTVHLEPSWRDARSLWSRADRVVPDNYLARAYEADFARMDGDLRAAERFARSSVALAPGAANAGHDALADVLAAEGRTAEAVREYAVATGLAPTNPMLRYQWAVALIDAHDDRGARPQLERAIAMDPGLTVPRHALAYLFARHQQWPAAIAEFGRLVTMDLGNAMYQGELADALRLGGDPAGAVPHYAAAIAGGDRRPDWEAELAWLTAVDGSASTDRLASLVPLAKDAADRTAGRDPFPAYAYSLVLARLGRFDDAVAAATTARELARATGKTALADAIDRRLAAYRQGLPAAPAKP